MISTYRVVRGGRQGADLTSSTVETLAEGYDSCPTRGCHRRVPTPATFAGQGQTLVWHEGWEESREPQLPQGHRPLRPRRSGPQQAA